ncbi:MAG: DUF4124 domain-containing protein [Planctomycetota bacterium]|jgi:hypothetical protein|nr:DUF4124 domain-containing protein [Planctomycetota bacterium]
MRLLPSIVALGLLLATTPAGAEIYRWVDESGTTHYTDRSEGVPPQFRRHALTGDEIGRIPFNQLDGLNVLPGAADGTDAGETPPSFDPANLDNVEALKTYIEGAGAVVFGAAVFAALALIGLFFAFSAWVLLLACKVVGQDSPGFKKAYGIVIVQTLAGALAAPGLVVLAGEPSDLRGAIAVQGAGMVLGLVVNALVLRGMLTQSVPRAFVIAVVSLLLVFGIGLVAGIGIPLFIAILA